MTERALSARGEVPSSAIDSTRPSVARMYDAILGGKDNFAVDRAEVEKLYAISPQAPVMARANRAWLGRVVRFLAGNAGIDQFLDLGSGMPAADNTHEIARRANFDVQVVYVDKDPVVAAYGRALLEDDVVSRFLAADFTDPDSVLHDPLVTAHLDFSRPVALIFCLALHHVSDEQKPYEIMDRYVDALPSGSYVAVTHLHDPSEANEEASALAKRVHALFAGGATGSGYARTREQIEPFFAGLELGPPGLVPIVDWWPDGPAAESAGPLNELLLGGVGRKP
ncbi:SAM-dependent methyltransferase [Amycolatopsis sp. H20-H5]|uniref:SAM-dependent methyltransferase n=1 Tax=Amycolatopsis sp. H20-H5 TaxID=3046309 RepID=UPI002DBA9345|nr:SAM-dependent methyltransferase [Amycolatopsis sp. H20-H5]MEC3979747.1 SAM-dependent methyltransferase [Amycolatopsis sp. H20-H5]